MNSRNLLNLGLLLLVGALALVALYEPGKAPPPEKASLTALDPEALTRIRIERRDAGPVTLERRGGHWYLTEPVTAPASDYRARAVARLAQSESLRRYPADGHDLAGYGLAEPPVRVSFDDTLSVALGESAPLDHRRYALVEDTVHLIRDDSYYHLVGGYSTFVASALLPPDSRITALELPGFTLEHKAERWNATPEPADFSPDAVTALLERWQHAQAIEVRPHPGAAEGERIRIHLAGRNEPLTFVIIERDPDLVLARPDLGLRYHLAAEQAEELLALKPVAELSNGAGLRH